MELISVGSLHETTKTTEHRTFLGCLNNDGILMYGQIMRAIRQTGPSMLFSLVDEMESIHYLSNNFWF